MCKTNMHLFITFASNLCINNLFWYLMYNRADAPICVLEDNDRETKLNLKYPLKFS